MHCPDFIVLHWKILSVAVQVAENTNYIDHSCNKDGIEQNKEREREGKKKTGGWRPS